jgi:hypothetical protein
VAAHRHLYGRISGYRESGQPVQFFKKPRSLNLLKPLCSSGNNLIFPIYIHQAASFIHSSSVCNCGVAGTVLCAQWYLIRNIWSRASGNPRIRADDVAPRTNNALRRSRNSRGFLRERLWRGSSPGQKLQHPWQIRTSCAARIVHIVREVLRTIGGDFVEPVDQLPVEPAFVN